MPSEKRSIKNDKVAKNLWIITPPPRRGPVTQQNPTSLSALRAEYPFQLFGPHAEILGMKTLQPPQNTFPTSKKNCGIYIRAQWESAKVSEYMIL
jgi:hypothetical protein